MLWKSFDLNRARCNFAIPFLPALVTQRRALYQRQQTFLILIFVQHSQVLQRVHGTLFGTYPSPSAPYPTLHHVLRVRCVLPAIKTRSYAKRDMFSFPNGQHCSIDLSSMVDHATNVSNASMRRTLSSH